MKWIIICTEVKSSTCSALYTSLLEWILLVLSRPASEISIYRRFRPKSTEPCKGKSTLESMGVVWTQTALFWSACDDASPPPPTFCEVNSCGGDDRGLA